MTFSSSGSQVGEEGVEAGVGATGSFSATSNISNFRDSLPEGGVPGIGGTTAPCHLELPGASPIAWHSSEGHCQGDCLLFPHFLVVMGSLENPLGECTSFIPTPPCREDTPPSIPLYLYSWYPEGHSLLMG